MSRIFISYKRTDKNRVFPIRDRIEAVTGEQCWIDMEGIESDAQFVNVIMRAIDEADLFLFMFSRDHSKIDNFETDWTVREINYAQKKKKRIVIVNLDRTPMSDWFEFMFGLKQQVDATNDQAIDHLTKDICKWLHIKPKKLELNPKQTSEPKTDYTRPVLLRSLPIIICLLAILSVAAIMIVHGVLGQTEQNSSGVDTVVIERPTNPIPADSPVPLGGTLLSVTGNHVLLREGPGTEYKSCSRVNAGTLLISHGLYNNEWYLVEYNDKSLYINAHYVRPYTNNSSKNSNPSSTPLKDKLKVIGDGVCLRTCPSLKCKACYFVNTGTVLTSHGLSNDSNWYEVEYMDKTLYINRDYVQPAK